MQRSSSTFVRNIVVGCGIAVMLLSILYYLKRLEVAHVKKEMDSLVSERNDQDDELNSKLTDYLQKLEDMTHQLSSINSRLQACEDNKVDVLAEVQKCKAVFSECTSSKEKVETSLVSLNAELGEVKVQGDAMKSLQLCEDEKKGFMLAKQQGANQLQTCLQREISCQQALGFKAKSNDIFPPVNNVQRGAGVIRAAANQVYPPGNRWTNEQFSKGGVVPPNPQVIEGGVGVRNLPPQSNDNLIQEVGEEMAVPDPLNEEEKEGMADNVLAGQDLVEEKVDPIAPEKKEDAVEEREGEDKAEKEQADEALRELVGLDQVEGKDKNAPAEEIGLDQVEGKDIAPAEEIGADQVEGKDIAPAEQIIHERDAGADQQ